jgi:hypothetical protein
MRRFLAGLIAGLLLGGAAVAAAHHDGSRWEVSTWEVFLRATTFYGGDMVTVKCSGFVTKGSVDVYPARCSVL